MSSGSHLDRTQTTILQPEPVGAIFRGLWDGDARHGWPGHAKPRMVRMVPRHKSRTIFAIAAGLIVGCHSAAPTQPTTTPAVTPYASGSARPQPGAVRQNDDDVRGTAEVLAQKATTYAQTVGPLAQQHAGPATGPAAGDFGASGNQPATRPAPRLARPGQ